MAPTEVSYYYLMLEAAPASEKNVLKNKNVQMKNVQHVIV
jgi:hypothetical protein